MINCCLSVNPPLSLPPVPLPIDFTDWGYWTKQLPHGCRVNKAKKKKRRRRRKKEDKKDKKSFFIIIILKFTSLIFTSHMDVVITWYNNPNYCTRSKYRFHWVYLKLTVIFSKCWGDIGNWEFSFQNAYKSQSRKSWVCLLFEPHQS